MNPIDKSREIGRLTMKGIDAHDEMLLEISYAVDKYMKQIKVIEERLKEYKTEKYIKDNKLK